MRTTIHILILVLASFFCCEIHAQISKKEMKAKMKEMMLQIKTLKEKGQLDSVITYAYNLRNSSDTSVQLYESTNQQGGILEMVVIDGDTLYVYNMSTFAVVDMQPYGDVDKDRKFRRLRYHVKKVYPYAKIAADNLTKYNAEIDTVTSQRKKRKLMKLREKALKEEFEDVIKKMSKTSGRVLIKLIDRETGESTYQIIKEMRGGFKAWTYQGIGKLYGADLKQRYDPKTNPEDEMIERVVQSLIAEGENIH